MSTTTPNLHLVKPAVGETADITVINSNMDIIDAAVASGGGAEIHTGLTASSWTSDTTYEDFGYRCAIAISGVTASDVAEVIFDTEQAMSGDYAPVCQTYAGGVYIYSADNASISIPVVLVHKG